VAFTDSEGGVCIILTKKYRNVLAFVALISITQINLKLCRKAHNASQSKAAKIMAIGDEYGGDIVNRMGLSGNQETNRVNESAFIAVVWGVGVRVARFVRREYGFSCCRRRHW
jgi:hypothetical protein